jgi:hypothetical protein
MAKIKGAGRALLERVAAGNVLQMQLGAAVNQVLHGRQVAGREMGGIFLYKAKESRVLNQPHFQGFGYTAPPVPVFQGQEKTGVIKDGVGRSEIAQEVLLAEGIHAVLHPNTGIVLRQNRSGDADVSDAAVRHGGHVAHQV